MRRGYDGDAEASIGRASEVYKATDALGLIVTPDTAGLVAVSTWMLALRSTDLIAWMYDQARRNLDRARDLKDLGNITLYATMVEQLTSWLPVTDHVGASQARHIVGGPAARLDESPYDVESPEDVVQYAHVLLGHPMALGRPDFALVVPDHAKATLILSPRYAYMRLCAGPAVDVVVGDITGGLLTADSWRSDDAVPA